MEDKLKKYNKKRDFDKTKEPEGVSGASDVGLRFVVQHHMARREHYDLRLEWDGVLLSWAVPKGPSFLPGDKRLAVHVEDHPLEYRHFEGTIPKGEYGGGTVMIWDEGFYEPYSDMGAGLKKGSLKFTLSGSRLRGRWALVRLKEDTDSDKEQDNWLLIKDKDEFALDEAGIMEYVTSITTGRTMAEIEAGEAPRGKSNAKSKEAEEDGKRVNAARPKEAEEDSKRANAARKGKEKSGKNVSKKKGNNTEQRNPFKETGVQLAKLVDKVPSGDDWLYEFKYDGYRIVSYIENNKARLLTRNGFDYADKFGNVTESLINFADGRAMVFDGEMAVIDATGRTDFQALQNYLKNPQGKNLTYIVFDLLALDGIDLRNKPLIERKSKLEALLINAPGNIYYSRHVQANADSISNEDETYATSTSMKDKNNVDNNNKGYLTNADSIRKEVKTNATSISAKEKNNLEKNNKGHPNNADSIIKDAKTNATSNNKKINVGEESLAIATKLKMEGIIGKKADSVYSGSRNNDWIKIKCDFRQDFVIGGYTISEKSVRGLSSVLLGYYEDGKLVYAGRAGTGFTEKSAKELLGKFRGLERKTTAFTEALKERVDEDIVWLRPTLVAEIKFAEWTKEKQLRQASFKGLRVDKEAGDVVREVVEGKNLDEKSEVRNKWKTTPGANVSQASRRATPPRRGISTLSEVRGVKISNPDKVIFENPEITKMDIIRYYERVAEKMLPYVEGRILSIVRCPKGVEGGTCFYKKHPEPGRQGIVTMSVTSEKKNRPAGTLADRDDYFYIEDIVGLISEAQMGTLEFHTWGSRADKLEYPDIVVFDLDPDEGMDLKAVRQGVKDLRTILDELSLNPYLKTSGGKGYHVVVPLEPVVEWDKIKEFAKSVVQVMESKWQGLYTSNSRKASRSGKIYVDWQRNGRGATSIAPYSLRARTGAAVSMPIAWEELSKIAPDGIDIKKALRRLKKEDPWDGFFEEKQRLKL